MNSDSLVDLDVILDRLQDCANAPFESAHPIPSAVHHSQDFLIHEYQSVFMKAWICVGREDEIPTTGDYLTHHIAQTPILVVRQESGEIRAFVNACAHRFACLVNASPQEPIGRTNRFTCPYHAWTYDLSGALIRAPYMEMKPEFSLSNHHLQPLGLAIWEGFIYVTLCEDKDLPDPTTELAPFCESIVGRYAMSRYHTVLRETMTWKANWKNLIENFTESYHVPIAHGNTFAQHDKPLEEYVCGEDSDYYCYHHAAQAADSGPGAAHPDNPYLEGIWRRTMVDFCVFPCHLVTLMPDYLWYITVQPKGTDEMQATWGVAIPPEILKEISPSDKADWIARFKSYIDIANGEDKHLVEALHQGSRSPILPKGTFHPIERNLWQFNRYLAKQCTKNRSTSRRPPQHSG